MVCNGIGFKGFSFAFGLARADRFVSFPEPLVVVPAKTSDDGKARRLPGSKSPRACRAADYDSKNLLKVCNDKNNVRR
jgi:hypothetical protein